MNIKAAKRKIRKEYDIQFFESDFLSNEDVYLVGGMNSKGLYYVGVRLSDGKIVHEAIANFSGVELVIVGSPIDQGTIAEHRKQGLDWKTIFWSLNEKTHLGKTTIKRLD